MPLRTRSLVFVVGLVVGGLVLPVVGSVHASAQEGPTTTAPSLLIEGTAPATVPAVTPTVAPVAADAGDDAGADSTSTRLWVAVGLLLLLSVVVAWLTITYWRVTRPAGTSERQVVDLDDLVGSTGRRR